MEPEPATPGLSLSRLSLGSQQIRASELAGMDAVALPLHWSLSRSMDETQRDHSSRIQSPGFHSCHRTGRHKGTLAVLWDFGLFSHATSEVARIESKIPSNGSDLK